MTSQPPDSNGNSQGNLPLLANVSVIRFLACHELVTELATHCHDADLYAFMLTNHQIFNTLRQTFGHLVFENIRTKCSVDPLRWAPCQRCGRIRMCKVHPVTLNVYLRHRTVAFHFVVHFQPHWNREEIFFQHVSHVLAINLISRPQAGDLA